MSYFCYPQLPKNKPEEGLFITVPEMLLVLKEDYGAPQQVCEFIETEQPKEVYVYSFRPKNSDKQFFMLSEDLLDKELAKTGEVLERIKFSAVTP